MLVSTALFREEHYVEGSGCRQDEPQAGLAADSRCGSQMAGTFDFRCPTLPFIISVAMELSEATRKGAQILDEERIRPTVSYTLASDSQGISSPYTSPSLHQN